jgi:hypothetical protein
MSPSIFREKDYRFYFLSNEEDRIHVHVTCENGEAKFWIKPIISLALSHIIEEHENEIIKAWQRHFNKR